MINKDFIKMVMIALTIATPIAFYFMNRRLEDFAYRITLPWWQRVTNPSKLL